MPLEVNGKSFETDEEGYLANLNDWQPDLAEAMASADGAELSENHWEVINFLREYYEELGHLALKDFEAGSLNWENPKVKEIIENIKKLESNLEAIENDVTEIKNRPSGQ